MADKIASAWATILASLGYDPKDPHFKDTPERVARFFREWHTQGKAPPKLTTFPNEGTDQMILTDGFPFFSMCAHHGVIFHGVAAIGFVPGKKLLGLSKFGRVIDHFANRFTVQERMTKEIADYLQTKLKPRGLGVVVRGEHFCMSARGVKKPGHLTSTSDMRGVMRTKSEARAEMLSMLR